MMMNFRKVASYGVIGCCLALVAPATGAFAQHNNLEPASAQSATAGPQTWSKEQLLTSTVHQAWLLSGKNEATFFEMVKQLAEISADNRGVTLPDDEAAGRHFGTLIKTYAKADTDQLLYAVVDKAVVSISKMPVHVAGHKR
jgi:hypothetical protein